ncbi:hypothetical protein [Yoonia sp. SDW83-1]|uniref:hypothetical protein n=1 Tax=Yoonia sp. SDW83-1 TaxID=3366945 RepID=UPI00398C5254
MAQKTSENTHGPSHYELMPVKTIIGYIFGFIALVLVGNVISNDPAQELVLLIAVASGLGGWITGILLSPRPSERPEFAKMRAAIVTFASGYGLAKLDIVIQMLLSPENFTDMNFLRRLLIAIIMVLLGFLFTFIGRRSGRLRKPRGETQKTA